MPGYNFSKEQMAARISGFTAQNIHPLWTQCSRLEKDNASKDPYVSSA
jgi:hypothetical protein